MGHPTDSGYDPRTRFPDRGNNPFAPTGWWTNQTSLGDTRQMAFPSTNGVVIDVASVDKLSGPMPRSVTLQRRILYPTRFNNIGANCDVRAQISFGSGAASQTILCDWNPGTQLDFAGNSFVRIAAVTYAPDPDDAYRVSVEQADASIQTAQIQLSAGIGMTGGPHPRPRFTQRLSTINAAASSPIITPPPWAHAVQLVGGSTEGGSIFVAGIVASWIAPDGTPFNQVNGTQMNAQDFLPIPNGSRLQIANGTASNQRITLLWELAL